MSIVGFTSGNHFDTHTYGVFAMDEDLVESTNIPNCSERISTKTAQSHGGVERLSVTFPSKYISGFVGGRVEYSFGQGDGITSTTKDVYMPPDSVELRFRIDDPSQNSSPSSTHEDDIACFRGIAETTNKWLVRHGASHLQNTTLEGHNRTTDVGPFNTQTAESVYSANRFFQR